MTQKKDPAPSVVAENSRCLFSHILVNFHSWVFFAHSFYDGKKLHWCNVLFALTQSVANARRRKHKIVQRESLGQPADNDGVGHAHEIQWCRFE